MSDAPALGSTVLEGALVYPTIRKPEFPNRLLMGVLDADGALVESSLLDRRSGEIGARMPADEFEGVAELEVEEGIFAGVLYFHFGHFLVESLARAWYFREHPDVPILWAGSSSWTDELALRGWQLEILALLGITNPVRIVTVPTRVARLHLPEIGYRYDDRFHEQHARFLGSYHGPAVDGSRIWLSRSRVASDVRDLNATTLERRLEEAGWTIVYPEQLTVREQLDTIARAEVIAGEEGSAFHVVMLLDDVTDKRFFVLRRLGPEHRNMHTIGDRRGMRQVFATPRDEALLRADGRSVTKVAPRYSDVLDLLEVPRSAEADGAVDPTIAALLDRFVGSIGAVRLLEIEIPTATAAPASTILHRVSVASRFPFDPRDRETSGLDLYEIDFDQYVATIRDTSRYDVVRVEAQTVGLGLRRIASAMPMSHAATVWWVDLPENESDAAETLAALHDALPAFRVRWFEHAGRARALLWRAPHVHTEVGALDSESGLAALEALRADAPEVAIDAAAADLRA